MNDLSAYLHAVISVRLRFNLSKTLALYWCFCFCDVPDYSLFFFSLTQFGLDLFGLVLPPARSVSHLM